MTTHRSTIKLTNRGDLEAFLGNEHLDDTTLDLIIAWLEDRDLLTYHDPAGPFEVADLDPTLDYPILSECFAAVADIRSQNLEV